MKKIHIAVLWIFPLISFAQNPSTLNVITYPEVEYQVIDGFGASDAWRAQFVGKNWPLEKRNKIADLLFSKEIDSNGNPKGIGLSIWRFYISAGTSEQGDSSDIKNPWRRGECFLNADGTYNWKKQDGQQWFLHAAKSRGVEKLLAFPNAPPVTLSNNGKGYAAKGDTHINLKPGRMKDYATFLVDVVDHFKKQGIFFDYLSPFNEPQWNWDDSGQEGTPALNVELYALIKYLSKELSDRKLSTQIVIAEAGTIGHIAKIMDDDGRDDQARFFFSKDSPFFIGDLPNVENIISAHSYFSVWPIEKQVEYRKMLSEALTNINVDLGYWQSEYCILQKNDEIGSGGGRDLGMSTALYVARIIHHDMILCNAKSWQWWTAISQVDYKDGLIYLDDGSEGLSGKMGSEVERLQFDGEVRDSKLLWTLGNYSRFVRPGMVRIKCELSEQQSIEDGLLVSAYKAKNQIELVYVFTNLSHGEIVIDLGHANQIEAYTTDQNHNLKFLTQLPKRDYARYGFFTPITLKYK